MKRLVLFLFLVSVPAFAADRALTQASPADLYTTSAALVIGEYSYGGGWPALPGVKQDAAAVAQALSADGFTVLRSDNPTKQELISTVDSFMRRYGADAGARVLIYFAGHGHTITKDGEKTGYIVLRNAKDPSKDMDGFMAGSLPMDYFSAKAKSVPARHTLFIFDSCFSGTIFSAMRSIPDFMREMLEEKAREFITSGTEDQQVPDVSVFRQRFIDGINGQADGNGDGLVTGSELGMFVQQKVSDYSAGTQTPVFGKMKDADGEFVFFVNKNKKQNQQIAELKKPMPQKPLQQKPFKDMTEKDRLIAVISRNPESPQAYAAMKRLREIDPSMNNMPPVTAPERKDFEMSASSSVSTTSYYNGPEYPFVIIAPVTAYVNGRTLTAAFRLRAADGASYRRMRRLAGDIRDAAGSNIENSGIGQAGSVPAARAGLRNAARQAVDSVCPGCLGAEPQIAGIRVR